MAEHNQYPDTPTQRPLAPEPEASAGAPGASSSDDVATILKGTREQYGRNLRDVAGSLNIRYIYLEAIEAGEFDKLPGTAYAIGFVRSYADYLGLDSKDLVRQFKAEVEGLGKQTQLVFPTPVPESKVPGGALILVSVFCFALAYGAWSFFSSQEAQVADLVPEVPDRLQPLIDEAATSMPMPAEQAMAQDETLVGQAVPADALPIGSPPLEAPLAESSAEPQAEPAPAPAVAAEAPAAEAPAAEAPAAEAPAAATRETEETVTETPEPAETQVVVAAPAPEPAPGPVEQPQAAAEPASTAPEPIPAAPSAIPAAPADGAEVAALETQAPQVYGLENRGARIVLRAVQDSWVQVRNSQDDLLLTRVLRAGDSYRVPNQTGLTLLTGNAGGLELEVDGSSLGPVGPVGSVRRNVSLDPARLLSGSAARQ